jgi:cell fate regulator YaaT (PSP1 superfamily)
MRDCARGCIVERTPHGELRCNMRDSCCKLSTHNWLEDISLSGVLDIYEVRFKNTHKAFFSNASGGPLQKGDIVAVEAANGHDVGIISMVGPMVMYQLKRRGINPQTYECKKIYRKAKTIDLEKWQEAISREHHTMNRARQIASSLSLNMKIGDVEFQGDGTKAIFYYIADERVDFRQLIKLFAEEFKIRIEMRQIGARQEAGLIGGIGVCGQELCCSRWMNDFFSISTQEARCQELSLNPQKLTGQCCKLKCCISYEAAVYMDAQKNLPQITKPIETEDGAVYLIKMDILRGRMWFGYDPNDQINIFELPVPVVREMISTNQKGGKVRSLSPQKSISDPESEFKSAVGEGSLTRFDEQSRIHKRRHKQRNQNRHQGIEK